MPKTKLTLSVDEALIRKAKRFSAQHNTTVSQLVARFLASLEDSQGRVMPVVSRLTGVLAPDVSREEYREHLRKKYTA
ncbi:MAG: DUF6364 family protein [Longimicrobiales bacterium]